MVSVREDREISLLNLNDLLGIIRTLIELLVRVRLTEVLEESWVLDWNERVMIREFRLPLFFWTFCSPTVAASDSLHSTQISTKPRATVSTISHLVSKHSFRARTIHWTPFRSTPSCWRGRYLWRCGRDHGRWTRKRRR